MRTWIHAAVVFVVAAALGGGAALFMGSPPAVASGTRASEPTPTAAEVRRWLFGGNALFASGEAVPTDIDVARRTSIAPSQTPWCTVLTCADSRVPPEHIFNAGLGRVFTVRVAGNIAEPITIGSVEYAVEHLHTPVVLVLGHERCGAVKAALGTDSLGPNLDALLDYIRPGIRGITDMDEAIRANVGAQVEALRRSTLLGHLEKENKVVFLGAVYDLDSGLVTLLDGEAPTVAHPHAEGSGH